MNATRDMPRAKANRLRLPCIDCLTPLPLPPWSTSVDGYVMEDIAECTVCGIRYSGDLLRTADAEAWAYVALQRLFCRKCDSSGRVPVVYLNEGRVVACDAHGPAPRRNEGDQ